MDIDNDVVSEIDFRTFVEGNTYPIGYRVGQRTKRFAKIGSFRKGVAIATLLHPDKDVEQVLVNVRCEIIYWPCGRYEGVRITRLLGGDYLLEGFEDVSAPGKDWHWVRFTKVISDKDFRGEVYQYPMDSPYERGKVVRYANTFYDLESYDVICSAPNISTFYIDSDLACGRCDVHDKKYYKQLLVEARNGDIVKCLDKTNCILHDETRRRIHWQLYQKMNDYFQRIPGSYEFMSEVSKNYDFLPPSKISDSEIFSKWFYAANALHFVNGIQNIKYTYGFTAHYIDDKYVIIRRDGYSCARRFAEEYLYTISGELIMKLPFVHYKRYGCYLISHEGVISIEGNGAVSVYPFSDIVSPNTFGHYNIGVIDKGPDSKPDDIILYNQDRCVKRKGYYAIPDENTEYYDIMLSPLNKAILNDGVQYEAIIKNYLYKFKDGTFVSCVDGSKCQHDIKPFKEGDIVYIMTSELIRDNLEAISRLCETCSRNVVSITKFKAEENPEVELPCGSDSSIWVFGYQPKGIMFSDGRIVYDSDPDSFAL